jgi:hypothetical protein
MSFHRSIARALAPVAAVAIAVLALPACAVGNVLVVGPGHPYATPCAAIAAAAAGDTIEIDAAGNGTYDGDVCTWTTSNLTITGINGRARIDAAGQASGAAIWVIVRSHDRGNVELSGAAVDHNGAGSAGGRGLTAVVASPTRTDLAGANAASDIHRLVRVRAQRSRRRPPHNMYIGAVRSSTLRGSWSHDANVATS